MTSIPNCYVLVLLTVSLIRLKTNYLAASICMPVRIETFARDFLGQAYNAVQDVGARTSMVISSFAMSSSSYKWLLTRAVIPLFLLSYGIVAKNARAADHLSVADMPTVARAASGDFISWREHRIDDQHINGGVAIRGGDGIGIARVVVLPNAS